MLPTFGQIAALAEGEQQLADVAKAHGDALQHHAAEFLTESVAFFHQNKEEYKSLKRAANAADAAKYLSEAVACFDQNKEEYRSLKRDANAASKNASHLQQMADRAVCAFDILQAKRSRRSTEGQSSISRDQAPYTGNQSSLTDNEALQDPQIQAPSHDQGPQARRLPLHHVVKRWI